MALVRCVTEMGTSRKDSPSVSSPSLNEPSRVFSINAVKFGDLESNGVLGDLTHSFLFLG
jgi:hypothetical protein